jgi:hypothetical protein
MNPLWRQDRGVIPILTGGVSTVSLKVMLKLALAALYFSSLLATVTISYRLSIHSRTHLTAMREATLHYTSESELLHGALVQPVLQGMDFLQKNERVETAEFTCTHGLWADGLEDLGSPRLSRSEIAQNCLPTPLQLFEFFLT